MPWVPPMTTSLRTAGSSVIEWPYRAVGTVPVAVGMLQVVLVRSSEYKSLSG